jgi:hypothetical protein
MPNLNYSLIVIKSGLIILQLVKQVEHKKDAIAIANAKLNSYRKPDFLIEIGFFIKRMQLN